jgi:cobalt-zinc-cadmium efflux system outer membrane protein
MKPFLILFCCYAWATTAQTSLTLEECEAQFRKNNLLLLAEEYNITAAEAAVIQARIWELPTLYGELNAYNPDEKKTFDIGQTGQKSAQVSQLIYLGGKKKSEVAFARSNLEIATLQFEQLVRELRYQLRESFYSIHYDLLKAKTTTVQLNNVDSLAVAYAREAQRGNIPLKDVVRLQSLVLDIKNELLSIQRNIFSEQERLKILSGMPGEIIPFINDNDLDQVYAKPIPFTLTQLQETMLDKNPEALMYRKMMGNNDLYLRWQKALAVPDLTLGGAYDQRGGAFHNQVNVTVGIPLPLWNKNKGNIAIANAQRSRGQLMKDQKDLEMKSRVESTYKTFLFQQDQYAKLNTNTVENLEAVYNGILENFQKRNISLIEFTDFMESYNQSVLLFNEMKKQIVISGEELNLLVNEKVF